MFKLQKLIDKAQPFRYEDDVTILPVMEEVAIVSIERRLMLKEEIHVRGRRIPETRYASIFLREQVAIVTCSMAENISPNPATKISPVIAGSEIEKSRP